MSKKRVISASRRVAKVIFCLGSHEESLAGEEDGCDALLLGCSAGIKALCSKSKESISSAAFENLRRLASPQRHKLLTPIVIRSCVRASLVPFQRQIGFDGYPLGRFVPAERCMHF